FTLARHGDAPQGIAKLDRHGVPRNSLLLATLVGFACIGLDYLSPDTVFVFLLNASGATILMVYLMIALSQIKLRGLMTREEVGQLRLKMWLFPYLSILAAGGILAVLVSMFFVASSRSQISLSVAALVITLIAYRFRRRGKRNTSRPLTPSVSATTP
ncbi:MAG: amino acid permease, partial [Rhodococcus sp. (in: high G+C Gram-positive bacteria)]